MKCHKTKNCKIISILMVLAMLISIPLGTVQIYAEEGGGSDITPPTFTEGYPQAVTMSPLMAGTRQISFIIDSPEEVYYYYVVLPSGATSPTKDQVLDKKDGDGNPALYSSNSGGSKYKRIGPGGILPLHNTVYDVYVVLKDDAGNFSAPTHVSVTSAPTENFLVTGFPQIGADQPDGSKQVEIKVKLQNINNENKGKIYWVLLPNDAKTPSIEQIAAGTDGNDLSAISADSPEFNNNIEEGFLVTGELGSTEYDLYMVVGHTYFYYPLYQCSEVFKMDVTTPVDIAGEKVCAIGSTEYGTITEAFEKVKSGETIKLLKSFTSVKGITIDSKNITLDLNNHNLNITTTSNEGLKASNATMTLSGNGKLNVSGKLYGVRAESGSNITVSNASAYDIDELGMGVYALTGSKVTVLGDAYGTAHGVRAENIYTNVIVNGNVSSDGQIEGAVYCAGQAEVIVKGNVTNTSGYGVDSYYGSIIVEKNVLGNRVGAMAQGDGANITIKGNLSSYNNGAVINLGSSSTITVDGEIITSNNYVSINSKSLTKAEGVIDTEKLGYLKYSVSGANGKVWVKDDSPLLIYILTVQNGAGGGNYIAGNKVSISANAAPEGLVFSHWTTDNGGSFADINSANTTFTMPANSVTVTANYKALDPSITKYTITASAGAGGTISPNGSISINENSNQTFVIIPNNNYKISSVIVDGVEQGTIPSYTFSNVTTNHAISAAFVVTTSSGIKTNGDSSGGVSIIVTIKPKEKDQPLMAATTLNAKLDKDGNGIVTVSDNVIKAVINKANSEAEKQKRTENGIGVCIETKNPKGMKGIKIVLSQPSLKLLTESNVQLFEIECGMLDINFNLEALNEICRQSNGDVTISISPNSELVNGENGLMEVRSAYDISLNYISNGKSKSIKDLNNGKVTLSIPYTLHKDEAVDYLFGILAEDKDNVNRIFNSFYDVNNKLVIIDNDILCTYGIGYIKPTAKFTDITTHWAKESIDYIVGRGLFKGTTDTTFSPDLTISRGMLITVLGRLAEVNVRDYNISSFSDVPNDMYYMPYIEWAYNNGIVNGVDVNIFEPDRGMTREEVALVLQNYAKYTNYDLPFISEEVVFSDDESISDFARDAVKQMQKSKVIMGDHNNKFNPRNAVSRGEVAAILQRYINLDIDK